MRHSYLVVVRYDSLFLFFFFNDTATTEISSLSLHDALPICAKPFGALMPVPTAVPPRGSTHNRGSASLRRDRKSTRLNSSHLVISYAVFCLKKKKHHCVIAERRRAALLLCTVAAAS